jgi:hypothetical protein
MVHSVSLKSYNGPRRSRHEVEAVEPAGGQRVLKKFIAKPYDMLIHCRQCARILRNGKRIERAPQPC